MKNLFKKIFAKDEMHAPNPNEIFIWPEAAMSMRKERTTYKLGLQVLSNIHNPSLTAYFPLHAPASGTALIIAPGGGHSELWVEHEGFNPAQKFCELGIPAFVLKYRLAKKMGSPYSIMEHSLADMQQAIRYVRLHAREWNINPLRIGVMGFSAGGELAGLAAIYFDEGIKNSADKILQQSCYPNFQALIYPSGAKKFNPSKFSPPLFLLAGEKDKEIANNITEMHKRYQEQGIPSDLHIYANENHGFGIQKNNSAAIAEWPERFVQWLFSQRLI